MVEPFADHDTGQGGAGKRPAPTIEGTATEVSVETPADEAAAAEAAAAREDGERDEPEEEAAPESEVESKPQAVHVDEEPQAAERRVPPPPTATMSEMKSFVTHLAAGLLGGLIGVIALAFAWHLIPAGKDESAAELGKIKERVAKLEATPAPTPDTEALAKLDGRIKALEGQTPPDIVGLTDRVAQLEQALKALASAAKDGGSVTDAAAINQQITKAEQRLQENLDKALADAEAANAATLQTMQASIDEMKTKIAALAEAGTGESPDLTALTERVAKLETAIDKGMAGSKSAAAAIAFANLSSAVAEGRPFAAELATIKSFVADPGDLGPLPAYADKGIATVPELARSFAASRDAALAAASPVPSGSLIDRLLASASTLVKVKRVDEAATGDSASAVLARAEALLDKGDLAGSVKQIETLDGAPREAFSAWLDEAKARLSADAILQRLEATLLASASTAPEKAQD
jgi:hypothetical protein